jgi:glyoxylase-like metal-dependent hydrolase (beta-lactamase superfamily II)
VGISSLVASTWLITSIALAASPVIAINQDAATVNVTGQALREHLSVLMGSGGNIGVLDGPGGLLLVDAGIAVSRPKIVAALSSISTKPVRFLINTHYHWDHTDGNEWLHAAGAAIIAHKNTLAHLLELLECEDS